MRVAILYLSLSRPPSKMKEKQNGRWDEKEILEETFDLIDRRDSARLRGEECARAYAAHFISSFLVLLRARLQSAFSPPGWKQIIGRLRTSSAGAGGNHSLLPAAECKTTADPLTHTLQPGGACLKPAPSPRVKGRQLCLPWLCAVPQHVVCLAESEFPCRDQSGLSSCIRELIATSLYRFNEQPSTTPSIIYCWKTAAGEGKKHT